MGYTKIKVWISKPIEPSRFRTRELLVDTGAVYTVSGALPRGVDPVSKEIKPLPLCLL
jgi:hypothetical protein